MVKPVNADETVKPQLAHVSRIKKYIPRSINSISAILPSTGKKVEFEPDKGIINKFRVHSIYTALKFMLQELSHELSNKIKANGKYRIPYMLVNKCEELFQRECYNRGYQ